MDFYGYFDHLPAEEDNRWLEAPPDELIEAMTKDEYKKEALAV